MSKLFANSEDPDQTPHSAASDLGLHCLPITLLGVSRLQWVNDIACCLMQLLFVCLWVLQPSQPYGFFLLCWGLTTRQPLWVILCRLPEKGRKEIVEEMKESDREERGTGMKVKKQNKNIPPLPLPATKDSRPCPTLSQFRLDAPVT